MRGAAIRIEEDEVLHLAGDREGGRGVRRVDCSGRGAVGWRRSVSVRRHPEAAGDDVADGGSPLVDVLVHEAVGTAGGRQGRVCFGERRASPVQEGRLHVAGPHVDREDRARGRGRLLRRLRLRARRVGVRGHPIIVVNG